MTENNSMQTSEKIVAVATVAPAGEWGRWLSGWVIMLCDVLLFSSAVNCLFLWLAYGRGFDGAAFLFSLLLALAVYYFAICSSRSPSVQKRLLIAVGSAVFWAVFMPVIMRLADYR